MGDTRIELVNVRCKQVDPEGSSILRTDLINLVVMIKIIKENKIISQIHFKRKYKMLIYMNSLKITQIMPQILVSFYSFKVVIDYFFNFFINYLCLFLVLFNKLRKYDL